MHSHPSSSAPVTRMGGSRPPANLARGGLAVFYWFKRGDAFVQYDVREVSPTRYELTFIGPDGVECVEHFYEAARQVTDSS